MKTKTLLITGIVLLGLAGMTVANMAASQQGGSQISAAATQLSEADVNNILWMREEEKLARDVYLVLYEKWGAEMFANISESEQQHMDAVKRLIQIYGLDDPVVDNTIGQFTNPVLGELYVTLLTSGEVSLQEALNVGITIEELDIEDLNNALAVTSVRNIQRVFMNLLNGSYNHLAAFEACLETCQTECSGGFGPGDGTCDQVPDCNMPCQNI